MVSLATGEVPEVSAVVIIQVEQRDSALCTGSEASTEAKGLQAARPTPAWRPFRFLDLPRELRDQIYDKCVVIGDVRVPRHDLTASKDMRFRKKSDAKAHTQLFLVNRQIYAEALETYLSKNRFVLPALYRARVSEYSNPQDFACIPGCTPFPPVVRGDRMLRSMSVALSYSEVSWSYLHEHEHKVRRPLLRKSGEICWSYVDLADKFCQWSLMCLAAVLNAFPRILRLQINLEHARCHPDCHQPVTRMFLEQLQIHQNAPGPSVDHQSCSSINVIDFLGTKNKEERDAIRRGFPRNERARITFHGAWADDSFADPSVEIIDEPEEEYPEEPQVDAPNNYVVWGGLFQSLEPDVELD